MLATATACSSNNQRTEAAEQSTTTVTQPATTTTTRPTVTTTTQPATTTTTLSPGDRRDLEIIVYASALETSRRVGIISSIEDTRALERVDVFAVETTDSTSTSAGTVTLVVEGSSGFSTAAYQIESAWQLATLLSVLWEADGSLFFYNDVGSIKPGLRIVVDGRTYVASHDSMVQVAQRKVSQADWLSTSKQ